MTSRERFSAVLHRQTPDCVPNCDFGYWDETIDAWHDQGLPADIVTHADVEEYLGLEGVSRHIGIPCNAGLCPNFTEEIIEEKGTHLIKRDFEGNLVEVPTTGASIPKYIKYGIETREDWELYKSEHLDPDHPDRVGDIDAAVRRADDEQLPLFFFAGSLYGWLRNWMGVENFSIALLTEKEWVEEMMDHLMNLTLTMIDRHLQDGVDHALWWEDMCYNHGPLCSPALFEELMVPRYRTITDALKAQGIDVNILDCDGKIYELVPGWLRGGINCMFPIEAAHTDPKVLRDTYGEELLLVGGVDKVQLAKGKDAIDRELEKLRPLVERGGYIPTVDHRIPPDVSYDNYLYYIEKKKDILAL